MTAADPRRSLELLRPNVQALNRDISALTPQQWAAPSSCAGWQLADLVSHVVRNGWSMLTFVSNTLEGEDKPAFGPSVAHVQEEIKAGGNAAAAQRQQRETEEFIGLLAGLNDEQLEQVNTGHPSGPRDLAWACSQRLAEVAYHHWDLRSSLAPAAPMDAQLARHLLNYLLSPERANIMVPQPPDGSAPQTFRLRSTADGSTWRLTATPGSRQMEADAQGPADVEVAAEPGWLALAIYGRVPIAAPHFQITGTPDSAERFAKAFGGT